MIAHSRLYSVRSMHTNMSQSEGMPLDHIRSRERERERERLVRIFRIDNQLQNYERLSFPPA
jgi:hypothetical protein